MGTQLSAGGSRWGPAAGRAARRLSASTAAGALLGLLVGGVGGRLAMGLLAAMNPTATGVISDDGFRIGQFTPSGTANLLVATTLIGALGGGIYLVLRQVAFGPRWFRALSLSLGPAIVVGSMVVHVDGVDFILLRPPLFAVAVFVAIPGIYAALLTVLAERWLAPDGPFARGRRVLTLAPLLLWIPLAPVLAVLVAGWLLGEWALPARARAAALWVARAGLVGLFSASLYALVRDTVRLLE
ncbi:hypothetical protein AB0M43_00905 [Longispora sp. NPDC051575]|uniref:hypothetical protein n=1 Tax=Longispora sp. NPDC051575 TaxID=3154943 RepID=UPI003417FADF